MQKDTRSSSGVGNTDSVSTIAIPDLNSIEIYKLYREKVTHEDTLINFRTTWFVALQAFLFTSFALSMKNIPDADQLIALSLFSGVGMGICFTTFVSVRAASQAIEKTTSKWKNDNHVDGDGVALGIAVKRIVDPHSVLPAIKGAGSDTGIAWRGSVSSTLLPIAIGGFWLLLYGYSVHSYHSLDSQKLCEMTMQTVQALYPP